MVSLVVTKVTDPDPGVLEQKVLSDRLGHPVAYEWMRHHYSAWGWVPLPDGKSWHGISMQGDELIMEIVKL